MAWDKARLAVHIGVVLAIIGFILSFMGWADFDRETRMIDIHPFHVDTLALGIAAFVSPVLSTIAIWFGWGRKK